MQDFFFQSILIFTICVSFSKMNLGPLQGLRQTTSVPGELTASRPYELPN